MSTTRKDGGNAGRKGYLLSEERETADVIVVNTSVSEKTRITGFLTVRRHQKIKERHPENIIAVCGCMMQQEHITQRIRQKYSWVDIMFRYYEYSGISPGFWRRCLATRKKLMSVYQSQEKVIEGLAPEVQL